METYNTFSRGSEWRKWDLHIHSNASDGKSTPAEIIKEANKEGVKKDDIVTILYATHQYVLIYESKDE